jgi:hypothetical protein
VRNWYAGEYNQLRKGGQQDATEGEDSKGKKKSAILSSYMVGEDGNPVSQSTKNALRETARGVYSKLLSRGIAPKVWGDASIDIKHELYYLLETSYPFLRYCDNHWKVKKVVTNGYSQWRTYRESKASASEIIDVDAVHEGNAKRPREIEGNVSGPSKRPRIGKNRRETTSGKQRNKVYDLSFLIIPNAEIA